MCRRMTTSTDGSSLCQFRSNHVSSGGNSATATQATQGLIEMEIRTGAKVSQESQFIQLRLGQHLLPSQLASCEAMAWCV